MLWIRSYYDPAFSACISPNTDTLYQSGISLITWHFLFDFKMFCLLMTHGEIKTSGLDERSCGTLSVGCIYAVTCTVWPAVWGVFQNTLQGIKLAQTQ